MRPVLIGHIARLVRSSVLLTIICQSVRLLRTGLGFLYNAKALMRRKISKIGVNVFMSRNNVQ